jgi:toxin ParE1/3/4
LSIVHLSRRAEDDLLQIAVFTLDRWGMKQTDRYLAQLQAFCRQVAEMPAMGRSASEVRIGLRRIEHGRHVIFFRERPDGILVVRFLHQSMLAEHQAFENEEE